MSNNRTSLVFVLMFFAVSVGFSPKLINAEMRSANSQSAEIELFVPHQANQLTEIKLVYDMVFTSESDGWQVGGSGQIWRYRDGVWVPFTSPTNKTLLTLDVMSEDDIWAAGSDGIIVHWNGNDWSTIDTPTTEDLRAIDLRTPTDGWAAGGTFDQDSKGIILHWDGVTWQEVSSPDTYPFRDIAMISETDGWLATSTDLFRWDGSNWTLHSTGAVPHVIEMYSSSHGWGASYLGKIFAWDGVNWTEQDTPLWPGSSRGSESQIFDFSIVSPTDAWAVGQLGIIMHWDGVSWTLLPHMTAHELRHVAARPSSHVFVQTWGISSYWDGSGWQIQYHGGTAEWDGINWVSDFTPEPTAEPGKHYTTIEASAPSDLWAIGGVDGPFGIGTTHLYRQIEGRWERQYYPNASMVLRDMSFLDATEGYLIGQTLGSSNGYIVAWDGTQFGEPVQILPDADYVYPIAVGIFRPDLGILITKINHPDAPYECTDCTALVYWNGSTWEIIEKVDNTSARYGEIFVASSDNIWIWGVGGLIQWDGTQFNKITDIPALQSISFTSETEGWGIYDGNVYRYQSGDWSHFGILDDRCDEASIIDGGSSGHIAFTSPDSGWATTTCQLNWTMSYLHWWDGETWHRYDFPHTESIYDLHLHPNGVWYGTNTRLEAFIIPQLLSPQRYMPLVIR